MKIKLRRALKGDETDLYTIKKSLPPPTANATRGGFLLGSSVETYRLFIESALVDVLEYAGKIVGFAVVLPDDLLRNSEMWQRKDEIEWEDGEALRLLEKPLCYFEQLAVLPGEKYRFYGIALALAAARRAFEAHEAMFATTVIKPICNGASIPFLINVGARRVGALEEFYLEFGELVSAVYLLKREVFIERLAAHRLNKKLLKQIEIVGEY